MPWPILTTRGIRVEGEQVGPLQLESLVMIEEQGRR